MVLQTLPVGEGTDYINASFVDVSSVVERYVIHNISVVVTMQGYSKERAYIAAQGEYKPCPADFLKWLFLVYRSHGHFS